MIIIIIAIVFWSIAGLFLFNALYKRTNHYNNQLIDVRKYWDMTKFPKDLQVVNLGSNHPKFGFDYSESGVKGLNCAVGPQTFEYDFAILRKIIPYLAPGAFVIIPVCLLTFFLYRQKPRSIHAKYYTFLPKKDIVDYNKKEEFKLIKFPLFFNPRLLRFVFRDIKKDTRLELTENPMKDAVTLEKDVDFWINCWNSEFDITLPSPILSQENEYEIQQNIKILKEMLIYCTLRRLKPVIAILPVTEHLSSRFTEYFIQTHIFHYINEANVVEAPMLNYLKDERFTSPELYINSFFMNKRGRKKITMEIIGKLIKA